MVDPESKPLTRFVEQLTLEGRAITRGDLHRHQASKADRVTTVTHLAEIERSAAMEAPYASPEFDPDASLWAAQAFVWAASMLVDRGECDVTIPKWVSVDQPDATNASSHWSVDLVFRLAGDLVRRGKKIAPDDPLQDELQKLLAPWPLACVGRTIENPESSIGVVTEDACLRTMYVDRVMLTGDVGRAASDTLQPWIKRVVGHYPQLGI